MGTDTRGGVLGRSPAGPCGWLGMDSSPCGPGRRSSRCTASRAAVRHMGYRPARRTIALTTQFAEKGYSADAPARPAWARFDLPTDANAGVVGQQFAELPVQFAGPTGEVRVAGRRCVRGHPPGQRFQLAERV